MTARTTPVRMVATAFIVAGGVALCLLADNECSPARAAQKEPEPACDYLKAGPTEKTAGKISPGIILCMPCHNGADQGQAKGFVERYKSNEFVLLNEAETWGQKDVHSIAMKCLTDPLGLQMEGILKKNRPAGYKVVEAPECLTCHSVDLSPTKALSKKKLDDFATLEGGVNCTACHGLYRNWQFDHVEEPKQKGQPMPWRAATPEYKYERGMNDLRNPVVKAQLCASCHVGSPAEGKVVTHEMYAAGHPPLPPFELASYMEGEPKHWGYPTELKHFESVSAEQTWKLFHFHPAKAESYLARHYAVGAIVSIRAEAELLLAEAKWAANAKDVMDYARFDCYACHHDLKYPSDRQKRGYDGPPGRPPLRAASGVPAGVVAKHAEGIAAGGLKEKAVGFEQKWAALRKAATAKPFGDPVAVQDTAQAMRDWCNEFLKVQCDHDKPIYAPDQAARLRTMLAEAATGPSATADPEAALVLTWGALTLAREGKLALPRDRLDVLAGVVPLNVRTDPFSHMVDKKTLPVQAQYPNRMRKIASFDSVKFVDAFQGAFGNPK